MAATKYIIVCDESNRHGSKYSYFFGGCIVDETQYESISNELNSYKEFLGLHEIKREKINQLNVGNYKKIIDLFFRYIRAGDIKVRIMYSPNNQLNQFPHGQDNLYSKLYYVFLKKAFSLFYAYEDINLKIYFDELPESLSINKNFKKHLVSCFINASKDSSNKVSLYPSNIFEVDSKNHVILQCIDVILGTIEFFLNTPDEQRTSKRALAKIEMFNHIYEHYITNLCENFSFDLSTGYFNCRKAWKSPYKHFVYKKIKAPKSTTSLQRDSADIRWFRDFSYKELISLLSL